MKDTNGMTDLDREAERVFGRTPKSRRTQVRDGLRHIHPEFEKLFVKVKHDGKQ